MPVLQTMENLPKEFLAIDTALSLHYSSSITTPKLFRICQKATSLVGKRIDRHTIERILGVDELLFKIISFKGSYDYGITVSIPLSKYGTLLLQRRAEFADKVSNLKTIEPVSLQEVAVLQSPVKSTSYRSPSTSPTKIAKGRQYEGLKKDSSSFSFKEKISAVQSSKAEGLSLLERIKLKERLNSNIDPKLKEKEDYHSYIHSKSSKIYDILYELASASGSINRTPVPQSFTLQKLISIIKDSSEYEISEDDISIVIKDLERKLGPTKLKLIEREHAKVIKVFNLDRAEDQKVFQNK